MWVHPSTCDAYGLWCTNARKHPSIRTNWLTRQSHVHSATSIAKAPDLTSISASCIYKTTLPSDQESMEAGTIYNTTNTLPIHNDRRPSTSQSLSVGQFSCLSSLR